MARQGENSVPPSYTKNKLVERKGYTPKETQAFGNTADAAVLAGQNKRRVTKAQRNTGKIG